MLRAYGSIDATVGGGKVRKPGGGRGNGNGKGPNSNQGINPSAANLRSLLHADGANGGIVFTESGSYAHTFTRRGTLVTDTSEKKFGSASFVCDGSPAGCDLKYNTATNLQIFNGAYTVEAWVYPTSLAANRMIFSVSEALVGGFKWMGMFGGATGKLRFTTNGGVLKEMSSTSNLALNTWQHVAFSRTGTSAKMFINGVLEGSASDWVDFETVYTTDASVSCIGNGYTDASLTPWAGYLDELRVSSECLYTAAFTPPTAAFPNP